MSLIQLVVAFDFFCYYGFDVVGLGIFQFLCADILAFDMISGIILDVNP